MAGEFHPKEEIKLPDPFGKVPIFSIKFSDWVEKYGFFVRDVWETETKKWGQSGWLELQPSQTQILDFALQQNEQYEFRYSTLLYSTIKKSGKTAISAAVGAWYAEVCPAGSEIYVVANDLEQAEGRVMRDLKYHAEIRGYKTNKYEIVLPNGTSIKALAQSYRSVAGARQALTLWDELWGITSELTRRTYEEMTPISTIPWSLRMIATYAGFLEESDLLWDMYIKGVGRDEHEDGEGTPVYELGDYPCWENGKQFTYWNHEPIMPWQTPEYYDQQRNDLRPAAYLRLHENRWVTTSEVFIPQEWWTAASSHMEGPADLWKGHPYRLFPVYAGVDAAPLRDSTAVTAVTYDAEKGIVVELVHKIWTPQGEQLDFDVTIKKYIYWLVKTFKVVKIGYDPAHLYQVMLQLKNDGLPVEEFTQTATNMVKASQNLFDLLKFGRYYTYKDEEAAAHVRNTVAKEEGNGFRIVKKKTHSKQRKPIDYTLATSIAAYLAVQGGGVDVSTPLEIESPFSDLSRWDIVEEMKLPPMFRSN